MSVAIIPARGGSKRVPRKNVREFCGRPMIEWSIHAALESGCFERVVVSTDDSEIADVARRAGAEVPFVRPAGLSGDLSGTTAVIAHAISALELGESPDSLACCLFATAPFVRSGDLRRASHLFEAKDLDYVLSITQFDAPIQRAIRLDNQGRIGMFHPENFHIRSQDLEPAYHDAGQFCWGTAKAWMEGKPVFLARTAPYLLPRHRVQDIDTLEDWKRAERMFRAMRSEVPE
jgi:pseudaminic acid cytidylyltransferase